MKYQRDQILVFKRDDGGLYFIKGEKYKIDEVRHTGIIIKTEKLLFAFNNEIIDHYFYKSYSLNKNITTI